MTSTCTVASYEQILLCQTPDTWIDEALKQQDILLIDHAQCEKKAASTALNLIYRYADKVDLLQQLSKLAREELRHFEQVLDLLGARGITYRHLPPSRYAGNLHRAIRQEEPHRLVDALLLGALIEARSCERFAKLAPHLADKDLQQFYLKLVRSEARHFLLYMDFAEHYSPTPIDARLEALGELEAELIQSVDPQFRFHSGVPQA